MIQSIAFATATIEIGRQHDTGLLYARPYGSPVWTHGPYRNDHEARAEVARITAPVAAPSNLIALGA